MAAATCTSVNPAGTVAAATLGTPTLTTGAATAVINKATAANLRISRPFALAQHEGNTPDLAPFVSVMRAAVRSIRT